MAKSYLRMFCISDNDMSAIYTLFNKVYLTCHNKLLLDVYTLALFFSAIFELDLSMIFDGKHTLKIIYLSNKYLIIAKTLSIY